MSGPGEHQEEPGEAALSASAPPEEQFSQPHAYGGALAMMGLVRRLAEEPGGSSLGREEQSIYGLFREVVVETASLEWSEKSLPGLSQKMLWRDGSSGASIALVRFAEGAGIPSPHAHASNQFMLCLSGRYRYVPTGLTLVTGSFYWNPKGSMHGPTLAEEESVLLEIYDGPHYPTTPDWYTNPEDAR